MTDELVPFLPGAAVAAERGRAFSLDPGGERSIGRMHGFHGNVGHPGAGVRLRVPPRCRRAKEVSELAALNANYLARLVGEEFPLAYPGMRPMHEFVATAKPLREATGIRAMDVAKRVIDLGFHPSTVYFPLVVEEAMMVEPTETESKATLEAFAEALRRAAREAREQPDLLRDAPVTTPVRRLDEARAARALKLRW